MPDKQPDEQLITRKHFRALVDKVPTAILLLDPEGVITYASQNVKPLLGYEKDENVGKSVFEFVHPDDVAKAADSFGRLISEPAGADSVDVRTLHKDGSWRHVEVLGTNHLHDQAVGGIVINFHDITERKRTETDLSHLGEFHKRLAERNPDTILVLSAEGAIFYTSPGTEERYGFRPGELQGTTYFDLIHPDDLPSLMEAFADAAQKPGITATREPRFKHPDGTWHYADATLVNCLDDPSIGGIIISIRDTTERVEMERELKQLTRKLRMALEEVSTPVVQVWDGILALPLVGVLDDQRAQHVMEVLLAKIVETQSELIIIDVTGVPSLDTHTLNHLMRTVQATTMLGARCVLTGMQPEFAQSVTKLDLDLSRVVIKRDLQDGLKWALEERDRQRRDSHDSSKSTAPV